ncbi:hypothetical protein [Bacillus sp. AR18-7]|uniref:hypothetical protein n=1 Tax=Bacillus sp. AR18-7 TaxID=2217821 RepID=UPI0011C935AF|nr:hypothetical protein [Bacillus sp. AR18-7]TXR68232.1 hypothetical protein DN395_00670 [Bacillus sp. AR18-7]
MKKRFAILSLLLLLLGNLVLINESQAEEAISEVSIELVQKEPVFINLPLEPVSLLEDRPRLPKTGGYTDYSPFWLLGLLLVSLGLCGYVSNQKRYNYRRNVQNEI